MFCTEVIIRGVLSLADKFSCVKVPSLFSIHQVGVSPFIHLLIFDQTCKSSQLYSDTYADDIGDELTEIGGQDKVISPPIPICL